MFVVFSCNQTDTTILSKNTNGKKDTLGVLLSLSLLKPPTGFSNYPCKYGYRPPKMRTLLDTHRLDLWNSRDVLKDCIVSLNERDSSKIMVAIITNHPERGVLKDSSKYGYVKSRMDKLMAKLLSMQINVVKNDSLLNVSYYFKETRHGLNCLCYHRHLAGCLKGHEIEFCYSRYFTNYRQIGKMEQESNKQLLYLLNQLQN